MPVLCVASSIAQLHETVARFEQCWRWRGGSLATGADDGLCFVTGHRQARSEATHTQNIGPADGNGARSPSGSTTAKPGVQRGTRTSFTFGFRSTRKRFRRNAKLRRWWGAFLLSPSKFPKSEATDEATRQDSAAKFQIQANERRFGPLICRFLP